MSALTEHEDAQRAAMTAKAALAALNARIAAGDATVTGSDLAAAEADLAVADRLEAGALARMQDELAAAEEAAKAQAIADLLTGYRSTSSDLTRAIKKALTSLSELLTVASTHKSTTHAGLGIARLEARRAVPGHGLLQIPEPVEVIDGVIELAYRNAGIKSMRPHPELTVQPIAPFLPISANR